MFKLPFEEGEYMVKYARITIQNRIRPFQITILKHNLGTTAFNVMVSLQNKSKSRTWEYVMTGKNINIPVDIEDSGRFAHVDL